MITIPLDESPTYCVNCGHRATYLIVGAKVTDEERRELLINRMHPCRCVLQVTPVHDVTDVIDGRARAAQLRVALRKVREFVA